MHLREKLQEKIEVKAIKTEIIEMCANCKYWEKIIDPMGSCKRYPPVQPNTDNEADVNFPLTRRDTWCGEYRYKGK